MEVAKQLKEAAKARGDSVAAPAGSVVSDQPDSKEAAAGDAEAGSGTKLKPKTSAKVKELSQTVLSLQEALAERDALLSDARTRLAELEADRLQREAVLQEQTSQLQSLQYRASELQLAAQVTQEAHMRVKTAVNEAFAHGTAAGLQGDDSERAVAEFMNDQPAAAAGDQVVCSARNY